MQGAGPVAWSGGRVIARGWNRGQVRFDRPSLLENMFYNFLNCYSSTVVSIPPTHTHQSYPPQPSPFPTLDSTHLWICPCVLHTRSWKPFLLLLPIIPFHLLCGYCQFVLNFTVTGYILLACLFCWLGSTYRWDYMVFVFQRLADFT